MSTPVLSPLKKQKKSASITPVPETEPESETIMYHLGEPVTFKRMVRGGQALISDRRSTRKVPFNELTLQPPSETKQGLSVTW